MKARSKSLEQHTNPRAADDAPVVAATDPLFAQLRTLYEAALDEPLPPRLLNEVRKIQAARVGTSRRRLRRS
jgi:hypothetical protein